MGSQQKTELHIDDSILDQLLEPEVALPNSSRPVPSAKEPKVEVILEQAEASSKSTAVASEASKDQNLNDTNNDEEEASLLEEKWMELSDSYYKEGRGALRVNTWTHYKMVGIERKLEELLQAQYKLVELKKRFANRLTELKELH